MKINKIIILLAIFLISVAITSALTSEIEGDINLEDNYLLNTTSIKAVPTTNLVLYLPFEEGNGTLTKDRSGKSNDGTLNNFTGTYWVNGKVGKAIEFDGTNANINISDSPSLDSITNQITIEAWIKPRDAVDSGIINKGSQASSSGIWSISQFGSDLYFGLNAQWNRCFTASNSLTLNIWQHIAVTYNSTMIVLYINGANKTSCAYSSAISTDNNNLYIGQYFSSFYRFNGTIDEVEVYGRALSAEEVKTKYQQGLNNHQPISGSWVSRDTVYTTSYGDVGIGTQNPDSNAKLYVDGNLNVTGDIGYGGALQHYSPMIVESADNEKSVICLKADNGNFVGLYIAYTGGSYNLAIDENACQAKLQKINERRELEKIERCERQGTWDYVVNMCVILQEEVLEDKGP